MNVDVVCCWYLTCEQCETITGFSLKLPLTERPPRACPCGAEFSFEWQPRVKIYERDIWERHLQSKVSEFQASLSADH